MGGGRGKGGRLRGPVSTGNRAKKKKDGNPFNQELVVVSWGYGGESLWRQDRKKDQKKEEGPPKRHKGPFRVRVQKKKAIGGKILKRSRRSWGKVVQSGAGGGMPRYRVTPQKKQGSYRGGAHYSHAHNRKKKRIEKGGGTTLGVCFESRSKTEGINYGASRKRGGKGGDRQGALTTVTKTPKKWEAISAVPDHRG